MNGAFRSSKRRVIAGLAATAVIVTGLGLAFSTVEAASSVTPQTGPAGKIVHGSYKGQAQRLQTMLFKVDLNGTPSFMFCIDIATTIQFGVSYAETDWTDSAVPNLPNVARVLSQTNALTTLDPVEIAAAQSAIWHFSDGFELDIANPKNDPAVTARYNALVSDAVANPVANEPAGTLDLSPSTASVAQGQPAFYDVKTTATTPLSIELSDAAVTAHPATSTACDTATNITSVTGASRICLTSTSSRANVKMTLRTSSAPVSAGRVFIRPQRQKLIIGKAGAAQSSETVSASWSANGRPSVSVACPADGTQYGQASTYTAKATDPDGDTLTYQWTLDGAPLPGQTGPTISIVLNVGTRLAVTVTDVTGQTATADVSCPGKNKPTVALVCPDNLVVGAENTFNAIGSDPDGDTLTYQWELNGVALSGTNGPTLTTVINAGDTLRVAAADSTARVSDSVDASCIPIASNRKPTVTITCPVGMVYGQPATYTAVGSDPDGDPLSYLWSVNGTPVAGQSGPTATLTLNEGDTVSVIASDGSLSSDPADATCTGNVANRTPKVELACPKGVVYGQPATFTATGTDPDGNSLTYTWAVNGVVDPAQTGSTATFVTNRNDKITVVASDGSLASDSVEVTCTGSSPNQPPTVSLECPTGLVWGDGTEFTATGSDPEGAALTYEWKINDSVVAGAKGATVTATLHKGDVISVTAKDAKGAASASVTGNCAGNSRPKVSVSCPATVLFGEPIGFTATGTDDDGEALVYVWKINGTTVVGQTSATAMLVVHEGDRVNVAAVDGADLASDSVTVSCSGTSRPTVTITCPTKMVWGESFDFIANGVDPDGDTALTYSWYLNGKPVDGATGPKLTITLQTGDSLTVTVTDSDHAVSTEAGADCAGNARPEVALVCPTDLVFGEPTTFTTTSTDADGDTLTFEWRINGEVVADATGPSADLTVARDDRVSVTATDTKGFTSAASTSTCVGSSTPKVTTSCPNVIVYGEPAVFHATGTDDDGDTVTYEWSVNGVVAAGQTTADAILTVAKADVVAVVATDPTGRASASVPVDCRGTARPVIALSCPKDFVFGQPTKLEAGTTNAKANELVFTWAVNGKLIDGATRSTLTVALQPNDEIAVTAIGVDGVVAETVGTRCIGTIAGDPPPKTSPIPSSPQVLSSTIYTAATNAAASVRSLPVTGGEALLMALVALAALGAGLTLVRVSRRRHPEPRDLTAD